MAAPAAAPTAEHISLNAAATALGISRHRLMSLSLAGFIRAHPIAGRVFYRRADIKKLAAWLAASHEAKRDALRDVER